MNSGRIKQFIPKLTRNLSTGMGAGAGTPLFEIGDLVCLGYYIYMKFKSFSLYIYIHVHPYKSRPFYTNMQTFSCTQQGHIQQKRHQVQSISAPKYINKEAK